MALKLVSLGSDSTAATLAWSRAVLSYGHQPAAADNPELAGWIEAAIALDPNWVAPHAYGALMLASNGDIVGHERVLRAGIAAHPDDAWFPAALGMSRLLYSDDPEDAARWLEFASRIPGTDTIYGRAAARLREQHP